MIVVFGVGWLLLNTNDLSFDRSVPEITDSSVEIPISLANSKLNVDFNKANIPLEKILNGGPGKDGIPALTDPLFVSLPQSRVNTDSKVIVVQSGGEVKFYPLSILVWHEIVNDEVGGKPLAITFCPLCGSSIVFERQLGEDILEFGVSGFLYESNLLMYSRGASESLWSQSQGTAVVGDKLGAKLTHYPLQLLSFGEAKKLFPTAKILSSDTGYGRNYDSNPYDGYDTSDETIFEVSVSDLRFPIKEVFFIVPLDDGRSVAVRQNKSNGSYNVPQTDISIVFNNGQVTALQNEKILPGYYEMWFSWATYNQNLGIVFD